MEKKQIKSFAFTWNPSPAVKKGLVVLKTVDDKEFRLTVDSAEEFAAITAILNQSPVFIYPDGRIATGWEEVG